MVTIIQVSTTESSSFNEFVFDIGASLNVLFSGKTLFSKHQAVTRRRVYYTFKYFRY